MCLIAHAAEKKLIDIKLMECAYDNNSDGWGITYSFENRLYVCKRMSNFETFKKVLEVVPDGVPIGIHFRFATHGTKDLTNVHPFPILSIAEGDPMDLCMMHNGVMGFTSAWKKETNDTRSDTSLYVDLVLRPLIKKMPELAFDDAFLKLVARDIGNGSKFLFLSGDGRHSIVNESAGHTDKEHPGVWFSNSYSLRPSYRSNKTSSPPSYQNNHYSDWWKDNQSRTGHTTTPAPSYGVKDYVAEDKLSDELREAIVKKSGFGCDLIKPAQARNNNFGYGWIRNGNLLSHGGQAVVDMHKAMYAPKVEEKKEEAKVTEITVAKLQEQRLCTTDFRVMNLAEIYDWVLKHPRECASWLIANISFTGGLSSVEEWVTKNAEEASDFVFNKSHYNKIMKSKSAPTTQEDEEQELLAYTAGM